MRYYYRWVKSGQATNLPFIYIEETEYNLAEGCKQEKEKELEK